MRKLLIGLVWLAVGLVGLAGRAQGEDMADKIQASMSQEEQADIQFQAADWAAAAVSYGQLVEASPDNALYWHRLGNTYLEMERFQDANHALVRALPLAAALPLATAQGVKARLHFSLARAKAGLGAEQEMLNELAEIAALGATPYLAVLAAREFGSFIGSADFDEVSARLKPCQSAQHRAFDFWLGEWQVTSPNRAGWQARSSITLGNDGCTLHEAYSTPGGYAGSSVNFFDSARALWHQTWVDNQGGPLYLEGGTEGATMVLTDTQNRITWTPLKDGRVRQHWEVTSDDGETFTTAFDGYYERLTE